MKVLTFTAKCSDLFFAELIENEKRTGEYGGYVPKFLSSNSDHVSLSINLETGQILDWTPPTEEQLEEIFKSPDDEKTEFEVDDFVIITGGVWEGEMGQIDSYNSKECFYIVIVDGRRLNFPAEYLRKTK